MRTAQAATILSRMLAAQYPVLLMGAPGVGKTDLVTQCALELGMDSILSHPALDDPSDAKGIPWPDAVTKRANFLPSGRIADVLSATRPTVWFLDDLGQAPPAVQAAYMQYILARRCGSHVLPDCVSIAAATNRRQDRAGVSGILEPVKSRFVSILPVEAHLDDWVDWALRANIDPEVIAFLRNSNALPGKDAQGNPIEMLSPESTSTGMENSPSPRTWSHVSKLHALGLPADLELPAYVGAVGEGAAVAFVAFLRLYRSMVSLDDILLNPSTAALPKTLSERYAVCTGLASKCSVTTYPRIATYIERINDAGYGEFSTLTIKDCLTREPAITATREHIRLMSGPVGKLILGTISN